MGSIFEDKIDMEMTDRELLILLKERIENIIISNNQIQGQFDSFFDKIETNSKEMFDIQAKLNELNNRFVMCGETSKIKRDQLEKDTGINKESFKKEIEEIKDQISGEEGINKKLEGFKTSTDEIKGSVKFIKIFAAIILFILTFIKFFTGR